MKKQITFKTKSTHQFMDNKTNEIETHTTELTFSYADAADAAAAAIEAIKAATPGRLTNIQLNVAIDHYSTALARSVTG